MQKITADSPESKSPDLAAENLVMLKTLFPDLVTESKDGVAVNVDVLKQLVGETMTDAEEKYGLNWHGKRKARQIALTPSTGTLRPCREDSVDWDTTQNLMIEGDSLEVIKILQKSYAGKVKMIYIDPPYNTGNDFVYQDDFCDNIENYLKLTGQTGEAGRKLSSNTEASGRFHTDWLNMMYPRLRLARNLLSDDGVILVSINEKEDCRLKILLDEIFGEENFVTSFVWHNNTKGRQMDQHVKGTYESIIVYARSVDELRVNFDSSNEETKDLLRDDISLYRRDYPLHNGTADFHINNRPNLAYSIYYNPASGDAITVDEKVDHVGGLIIGEATRTDLLENGWCRILPKFNVRYNNQRVWRWGAPKFMAEYKTELIFDKNDNFYPYQKKRFSDDGSFDVKYKNYIAIDTGNGKKDLMNIFGVNVFSNPKPCSLMAQLLKIFSGPNSLILDFFGGSGTTGHALFLQNALDGGMRKCIIVQLPEPLDPQNKDQEIAVSFCDKLGKPRNIAELTKERLRRAGKKIREENPIFAGDLGFRAFKLNSTNIREWQPKRESIGEELEDSIDHLKTNRTEQDILFELLLKLGLDLCVPIEERTIAGKAVHSIGAGTLIVCLAESVSRQEVEPLALGIAKWHSELAPSGEAQCVFRDSAFADDVAKTNLTAILEQHGLRTVRSL